MISDATFTSEEFHSKVKDFAQSMANRIPANCRVNLIQEHQRAYLLVIEKPSSNKEAYEIKHINGQVETISVYGK